MSVAAIYLIAHSTSWAMEQAETRSFTPHQFRLNQLFSSERVLDSNPAAPGVRGNGVPNLKRWNAILLQQSHADLKQPGIAMSPKAGQVVAPERQKVESQMGRIQ